MADIRALFGISRDRIALQAQTGVPAGFTPGTIYMPLSFAVDNATAPPTVYALMPNDSAALQAVSVANFRVVSQ